MKKPHGHRANPVPLVGAFLWRREDFTPSFRSRMRERNLLFSPPPIAKADAFPALRDQHDTYDGGVVFELEPNPDGTWTESVLYSLDRNIWVGGAYSSFPVPG
jgi:hypothetical protein